MVIQLFCFNWKLIQSLSFCRTDWFRSPATKLNIFCFHCISLNMLQQVSSQLSAICTVTHFVIVYSNLIWHIIIQAASVSYYTEVFIFNIIAFFHPTKSSSVGILLRFFNYYTRQIRLRLCTSRPTDLFSIN